MGDKNDIFAVARIRVREKYLLTDADISQMVSMKSAEDVTAFLLDKGWGDGEDQDPERMLAAEELKASGLMKELGIDREIFTILSYPDLYHNLKTAIKEVCTEKAHPEAFYRDTLITPEEMVRIVREKDFDALPSHMKKAAAFAYEAMLVQRDGQKCDVIVDRACLDAMEEVARNSKLELLRDYEESTVAVTNIRIAVRAARTGKSRHFLEDALAPCRSLSVKKLAQAASEGTDALYGFLTEAGFGEAVEALKVSGSAFERWCDNRLIASIRPQKRNSFTLGPVIAYYLARKNEIKTVRIILTAKANGLPEEAVRERMREMYV